jgi:hypothetical protein
MRSRPTWKWDEFKETAVRKVSSRLYATLEPRQGTFVVSTETYRQMKEPEAVVLLYDREERTIGVKGSALDVPHAVAVYPRHQRYCHVFRSKRFLNKHGILFTTRIEFARPRIDGDGVLILDLREAVAAAPRVKRRPRS